MMAAKGKAHDSATSSQNIGEADCRRGSGLGCFTRERDAVSAPGRLSSRDGFSTGMTIAEDLRKGDIVASLNRTTISIQISQTNSFGFP
jgi:hypothetical protein